MEIVSWIGFGQGLVLSLLLITQKQNSDANRYLAVLTSIISLGFMEIFIEEYFPQFGEELLVIWGTTSFLYGPLQYLYVKYLTKDLDGLRKQDLLHFLLPLIYLSSVVIQFSLNSPDVDYYYMLAEVLVYEILFVQLLAYSFASLRLIRKYRRSLRQNLSTLETQQLVWLNVLILLLVLVYITSIIGFHLSSFVRGYDLFNFYNVTQIVSMMLVYVISYFALRQPALFFKLSGTGGPKSKIPLKKQERDQLMSKINEALKEEKVFRNPALTLDSLSAHLGQNKYYVSRVINVDMGVSFYDLINKYRVEDAAAMILDQDYNRFSIEGISKEAGFKSKTTFNSAFKKVMGITPSEYKKSNK